MTKRLITVVETALFVRQAAGVWTDTDLMAFVDYIAADPEAGDLIPDTGGIRKVRWRRQGIGKRGGVRVIYFYHDAGMPVYLLMVYAKAQQENLNQDERAAAKTMVQAIKLGHGRK